MNTIHPDNPSYIDGYHYPQFDQRDADALSEREAAWNKRQGPRVGDFVKWYDGSVRRFTHDWGDGLQTTTEPGDVGSFYFGKGAADYSGSLDPIVPLQRVKPTDETQPGSFWFFHHDYHTAHNGVHFQLACRVFDLEERLFIGTFPAGIVYADRWHETNGDYDRLAFLAYDTLILSFMPSACRQLRPVIEKNAARLQAMAGELYETSMCGQTVRLGTR